MEGDKCIEHKGVVQKVGEAYIRVNIQAMSACASCHAKGACTTLDRTDKAVDIPVESDRSFSIGQIVQVKMQRDSGYKALLLGYVLPFILLMIVLITFLSIEGSELLAGILALLILVPYYTGLYFLRDRIKKTFSFSVSKI